VEKAGIAYLGVVATGLPEMLAEHLGLKAGEGIVVRAMMPDGPAAKAGIAVHDVITRVAGDPVGSSEELTARITARQPGEKIHLDIIHKGKAAGLDVALGNRPNHFALPDQGALDQLDLDGVPKELADRVRRMVEGNLGELRLDFENGIEEAAPQIEDAMRQMREQMGKAMGDLKFPENPIPQQGGIQIHQGATLRMMDDQGSIEVKTNEDSKEVTVRDKSNGIIWTGPWDTEQDKAAAPDDIRKRVERLNIDNNGGNGLRFNFRANPDK
jgi:hypothetical protein